MDDNTLTIRDDYLPQTFYDPCPCVPRPNSCRRTRHATSDVAFRVKRDLGRISENENSRRKRRTKPQHCNSCLSQSVNDSSLDSRPNDHHIRKNPEKLEASLTQHLDYTMSKIASSIGKNRNVQQHGNPSSPRVVTPHQRSQCSRTGKFRNRNNSSNTMVHHPVGKHVNIEPCECTRLNSPRREIINSDVEMEDADCRLPREHVHSRIIRKESDLYWHSPSGEPHFDLEMDFPPQNYHRDYPDSKKRHSGQGESVYDNCRESVAKVSIETGSSVHKDIRNQSERDQQELNDLYEDLGEFVKQKSAACVVVDSQEEDNAWEHPQQKQGENNDTESQELLEYINQFMGKVPVHRKGNASRVATGTSTKGSNTRSKTPNEQLRARSSKLDTRNTYHSGWMDERAGGSSQQQNLERNLDDELPDIQLESLMKQDEEKKEVETKEDEYLSETEEEARELAREDTETEQIYRQLKKSWAACNKRYSSTCNPQICDKRERTTREVAGDKEEKTYEKPDCVKKQVNTRERIKGKREKEVMISEESKSLRQNRISTNEAELNNDKRINTRERNRGKEEMADKMYEEFKNCYGVTAAPGAGDLELETSKTKTCIDEMIDSGLNRETKRGSGGTLQANTKNMQCEMDGSDGGPLKRRTNDKKSKIIRTDCFCSGLRTGELARATRSDCFCKTLAELVVNYRDPREYVRKLKNYRWAYLNHMQSDLEKLYGLEKYLDSCSPERRPSSETLTTELNPEVKEFRRTSQKKETKPMDLGGN